MFIEPLEARIAPAVVITNPLPDLKVGLGKTSAVFDLSQLTAAASSSAYRTKVQFVTNFDTDTVTPGLQAGIIELELFDEQAPLTVQNFLAYLNNTNARGDYDGTLFHRAVTDFVLQGGGFEKSDLSAHIPVFPTVHNEPDKVNRSNLAGTLAMAKVGGDPNSATSEWFINLKDNSSVLDDSNGGFTVFGKVLGNGLDLAKQIVALPRINGAIVGNNGDGGGTPVQNGTPIRVVDAKVVPSAPASTAGLTYTIESVAPVGTSPGDLVKASISGSKLTVRYTPGKSGVANVTVKVSDGTTSATDTFAVELRPNFSTASLVSDTLPRLLLPGDQGIVKVKIGNSGGVAGGGTVNLFLTPQTAVKNSSGLITSFSDTSGGTPISLGAAPFQVANGKFVEVSVPVGLGFTAFQNGDNYYRVTAVIVPKDTPLAQEQLYTDDDAVTGNSYHNGVNKFGTIVDRDFGVRTAVLKYLGESTNARPALVTWALTGTGSGTVTFDAQGKDVGVTLEGTTFASSATASIARNGARLTLASVDIADALGSGNFGRVDLSGPLSASGGVRTLTLGSVTGPALLAIGAPISDDRVKATLSLGAVENLSLESSQALASLTVTSWKDTDPNNDAILAPSLGRLLVTGAGEFEADVTLTDATVALSSVTVGGFVRNATIAAAGDIGAVKLGGIEKGAVFAGVTARPTSFVGLEAQRIASFTIAGIPGVTVPLWVDSQVAAQTIGAIKVKNVATTIAPGAGASGFVADVIGSYARAGAATISKLSAPQVLEEPDGAGGYAVTVL